MGFIRDLAGDGFVDGTMDAAENMTAAQCVRITDEGTVEANTDANVASAGFLLTDATAGQKCAVLSGSSLMETNAFASAPTPGQAVRAGSDALPEGVDPDSLGDGEFSLGIVRAVTGSNITFGRKEG
ncbi:hypothetical protein K8I61_17310 [bacterium]|nr:hypothetical protein [bacterium]